jgi:SAM-dependent methyltransferase
VADAREPLNGPKTDCRRFYDDVSERLDASVFGRFSFFLNLGYVPMAGPSASRVELPDHYLNRNSARLVLEVIGDCDLAGRRVLDVGCGRGGAVHVITEFFEVGTLCGVDLSPAAIAFCRASHGHDHVAFHVGDAERLPFPDGSFDVVLNIESSSTYPDIGAFCHQVSRVLAPGGMFLYTDGMPVERFAECGTALRRLGLGLELDRDITANVLRSCDEVARHRVQAYDEGSRGAAMDDFLATPGSRFYGELSRGHWTYRIQRWKKPVTPVDRTHA